jgi:hypothetical protein
MRWADLYQAASSIAEEHARAFNRPVLGSLPWLK